MGNLRIVSCILLDAQPWSRPFGRSDILISSPMELKSQLAGHYTSQTRSPFLTVLIGIYTRLIFNLDVEEAMRELWW